MEKKKLPKTDVDIRPLRTFQDDMAQAVKRQNETAISMSVKESEKRNRENPQPSKKSRNKSLIYLSVLFITLGVLALGFYFWNSKSKEQPIAIIDTILITDKEVSVNLSNLNRNNFVETINSIDPGEVGSVTNIKIEATPQEFLKFLEANSPSIFNRSLTGEMMFGVISLETGSTPFWIVEVDSYENAFGSLLSWEKTMADDLGGVFSQTGITIDAVFEDKIIDNRDVRSLRNGELLYAFLDQNTLIITSHSEAFRELLPLFISSKQIR